MSEKEIQDKKTGLEVAVIGMVCRFPGAKNVNKFWGNLKNGVDSISFFSTEELEKNVPAPELEKNTFVKAYGWLDDIEFFDYTFFGYAPIEAELMDPQTRILHECALEALEDAGYDPYSCPHLIGLYTGASGSFSWQIRSALSGKNNVLGWFPAEQLNDKDYMATRIANKLNLIGPAITVDTACSTALVAIHLAYQGLLSGDCDMALAGGISIRVLDKKGYLYETGMLKAPDGHCRAFDAKAKGTNFGNGVGLVVLKRLNDAIADKDTIHAVIKGSSINNDGARKAGYTAPSIEGQADVISTAYQLAAVEPETIGYVETHGTGTELGDPVEIEGLKSAFDTDKIHFCRIGSVKTNIGHLEAAAGAAGFIKTVLVLKHKLIPPSLFFEQPNPKIDFENSPFVVNTKLTPWEPGPNPRRAGVSSFGIGGTNAHVILEEAPLVSKAVNQWVAESVRKDKAEREYQLILLSAKTETALERMTRNLAQHIKENPHINLADAAYTLQVGRRLHKHRRMLVCPGNDIRETVNLLSTESRKLKTYKSREDNRPIVFMFSGLGSQYVNMGSDLYQHQPIFRREMDRCFEILEPLTDMNIKEILYPHFDCKGGALCPPRDRVRLPLQSDPINQIEISSVVVFIFEYALAQLLMTWGIKPKAMIGYSFGEYTAACVSGVLSLTDALKLVVGRGELLQQAPEGVMLSVPLSQEEINPYLIENKEISLAIDNGPSCVIAGAPHAVDLLAKQMKQKKIMCVQVPAARALHSHMMEPLLEKFAALLATITLNKPQIPYISNVTGDWLTPQEAVNPTYWTGHLRETVKFANGMTKLLKKTGTIFLEIGVGRDISALALRHLQEDEHANQRVLNLVKAPHQDVPDLYFLLNRIGRLWLYGQPIDWDEFHGEQTKQRKRISLPTYPFEGQYHWFESISNRKQINLSDSQEKSRQTPDFDDWFYIPTWTSNLLLPRDDNENPGPYTYLVFIDGCGLGALFPKPLQKEGHKIITVEPGIGFVKKNLHTYVINPGQPENYFQLFRELSARSLTPSRILHLWGITGTGPSKGFEQIQDLGFYSLLYIAKAIGREKLKGNIQINVVTDQLQEVTGEEVLCPAKAAVIGAVRVIPQEYPGIRCRCIDVLLPLSGSMKMETLAQQLQEEILSETIEPMVAYRRTLRWVQTFNPLKLDKTRENHLKLRENGVYLITGGLGNIGLMLADYLARKVKAKLILTGRSPLPPRQEWEQWLKEHDETNTTSQKIKRLQLIERHGAEIRVNSVDTADKQKMKTVITRAENELGPINGVIHAAGIMTGKSFSSIQQLEIAHCQEQFRPKVNGLLILEELFREREPDFFWLISSISTVLGGLGITAYAAANSFMDALAQHLNRTQPGKWISVNWDGMDIEKTQLSFERILSLGKVTRVVASNGGNLQQRIKHWVKQETLKEQDEIIKKELKKRSPRPVLMNPYVPPQGNVQQTLADIWQNLLGFEQIGIHDDFIELGGDSLKAIKMINHVHKKLDVPVSLTQFFKKPTIENLHQCITAAEKQTYHSIESVEEKEYYLLSSMQKRLYILHQMDPMTVGYNLAAALELTGPPPGEKLQECFNKLIRRHESLHTSFHMIQGQPVQKVLDPAAVKLNIEYYDMKADEAKVEKEEEETGRLAPLSMPARRAVSSFIRPFDLSRAPLLRVGLIKENPNRNILVVDMHHIVHDGISQTILLQEFKAFYTEEELPALNIRYKDFARWQNLNIRGEAIKEQESYWLQQFSGEIPVLDLPYDYPRPMMQSFAGATANFIIDPEETNALRTLALSQDATLFMIILAIYYVFLDKLSTRKDIVIGTPEAGRRHPDLQSIIGFFLHTLALRNYLAPDQTFKNFLKQVKDRTLQAFENQDYPFEDLVERVVVNRDLTRSPLFDVMFILHTQWASRSGEGGEAAQVTQRDANDLTFKSHYYEKNTSEFDLTLIGFDKGGRIFFKFEYCTGLFREETIRRFIDYFKTILSAVLGNPGQRIEEIGIIPGSEKSRLLQDFNDTAADYPMDKTIHQLFEEQVERTPGHVALVGKITNYKLQITSKEESFGQILNAFGEGHLTYEELNKRSHKLACLLKEKGVQTGTIAGVLAERTPEIMVALLAILKAGSAYLPLDPEHPRERVKYIIENSSATILLTRENLINKYHSIPFAGEVLDISDESLYRTTSTGTGREKMSSLEPAYVIYTSGSTGNPKGVVITHRNAVNFITAMTAVIDFSPGKTILALTTISFDIFFLETLLPVTCGLKVVIADERQQKDPRLLKELITGNRVNMVQVTPSRLQLMAGFENYLPGLGGFEELIVGGEAFPTHVFKSVKEHFQGKIYNVYGPTETTIWSTSKDLTRCVPEELNIGRPILNTQIYIVSRSYQLLPLGVVGELLIGGDGVAAGYLNNPELTAEKFINYTLQLQDNTDYYRSYKTYITGDLARWLANGEIEFLGRLDHQVKIRGFRIELEEIEEQLINHRDIKDAVVVTIVNNTADKHICAYVVPETGIEGSELNISQLRDILSQRLPHYMIPSYFVLLEQIPLTPNGKLDRKALPKPGGELRSSIAHVAPKTSNEKLIADLWKEVLPLEKVGVHDNFFELGGNSLNLIQLSQKLMQTFGKEIPLAMMFKNLTISLLDRYYSAENPDQADENLAGEIRGTRELERSKNTFKSTISKFRGAKNG
jgi:amino acid adenylation domain-containing protein